MSDDLLIKPKFRKSPREKRKQKHDRIGAGIIAGSAIAGGAAIYKMAKNQLERDYGKEDKGYKAAEKEGFKHTNKAKDFDEKEKSKKE